MTSGGWNQQFSWQAQDASSLLPSGWKDELIELAVTAKRDRRIVPPHPTSREGQDVSGVRVQGVSAAVLRSNAQWLVDLYEGPFRTLAARYAGQEVRTARGDRHTVVLNVQTGSSMRYECHLDTNPIQGMLYVTTHPPGAGGELVVANDRQAHSVNEVDRDASLIYPMSGHLLFFDGRCHPHYVRSLQDDAGLRVAVAMNYYTLACPESERPKDLDDYLLGEPV